MDFINQFQCYNHVTHLRIVGLGARVQLRGAVCGPGRPEGRAHRIGVLH
jgi:hypothetical protein